MTFIARSPVSDISQISKNTCFSCSYLNFEYARNVNYVKKNGNMRSLCDRYFFHITITKLSPNCTRTLQEAFLDFLGGLFLIKIPIVTSTAFPAVFCYCWIYQGSFDHVKVASTPVLEFNNLWCQIHMFLDILELRVINKKKHLKKNCFRNLVSDMWKHGLNCTLSYFEKNNF